jgi:hypothetical protein
LIVDTARNIFGGFTPVGPSADSRAIGFDSTSGPTFFEIAISSADNSGAGVDASSDGEAARHANDTVMVAKPFFTGSDELQVKFASNRCQKRKSLSDPLLVVDN